MRARRNVDVHLAAVQPHRVRRQHFESGVGRDPHVAAAAQLQQRTAARFEIAAGAQFAAHADRRVAPQGAQLHDARAFGTRQLRHRFAHGDARASDPQLPGRGQREQRNRGRGGARNPQSARRSAGLHAPFGLGGAADARQRFRRQRGNSQVAAQDFFVVDVAHVTSPTAALPCHSARKAWRARTSCDSAALSETCNTRAISGTVSSSPKRSSSMRA